ncbi:MAG TPA: hypothetical protein VGC53_14500 [Vicinamibacteria bacterium]|jgi:hypothetical protein
MRKWYESIRKRDGWVERKRRLQRMFTVADKRRELAAAREAAKISLEKAATE